MRKRNENAEKNQRGEKENIEEFLIRCPMGPW